MRIFEVTLEVIERRIYRIQAQDANEAKEKIYAGKGALIRTEKIDDRVVYLSELEAVK